MSKPVWTPQQTDWTGWRLLEREPGGQLEVWVKYEYDDAGTLLRTHYREVYNDQPAIDYAKFLRDTHVKPKDEYMRQQMVIPRSMLARSIREGWYADTEKWRKIARDSDYRKLRTTDDRV